jgi:iron complex outermembrane recepter protein
MIKGLLIAIGIFSMSMSCSMGQSLEIADTVTVLNQVVVKGYAYDRPINEVPAAIGLLNIKDLERYNSTSLLPAINTLPGVRMEERSPGSFRFAIRGSSLRSPFGVRNVKMYWNGLPLTDGGGNTYLNLLDVNAIGGVEVIKGPGGSLYGAGTGGVVLLTSPTIREAQLQFGLSGGSYGLRRYNFSAQTGTAAAKVKINYAHQQADGFRQQSAMRKDAFNADLRFRLNSKSVLSTSLFYTDLYYQTPGGLTKAEFDADQHQARPDTKAFAGSVKQQAAISNKTIYTGIMHEYEWNSHWSNRTGVYASYSQFTNPAIRNYEERKETNFGARSETQYKVEHERWKGKLTFGGEFQYFKSPVSDYGNRAGVRDTLQFADKLGSTQTVLFAQTEIDLPSDLFLTLGASSTFLQYRFTRTSESPVIQQTRSFTPVISPRIALLKKLTEALSVYGSVSQGFSTPSLAEVRPSSNLYNNTLDPEYGRNYEMGFRGNLFNQKISFDITGYYFSLNKTIVTPDGGDHYINSGKTSQPGIETYIGWNPVAGSNGFINYFKWWSSYTYNPYTFKDYHTSADFSGHKLTGVAKDIIVSGLDLSTRPGIYLNVTFTHTGAIPLNDANSISAPQYYLMGARAGYKIHPATKPTFELFTGVDNAFSSRYSLGNDLNAAGARYFNAAAPRTYYFGVKGTF